MRSIDRNVLLESLGLFAAVVVLLGYLLSSVRSHRYDKPRLMGKTMAEVERLLGPPTSRIDEDTLWGYQYGMDPDATVEFRDGKVINVWSAKRSGFK